MVFKQRRRAIFRAEFLLLVRAEDFWVLIDELHVVVARHEERAVRQPLDRRLGPQQRVIGKRILVKLRRQIAQVETVRETLHSVPARPLHERYRMVMDAAMIDPSCPSYRPVVDSYVPMTSLPVGFTPGTPEIPNRSKLSAQATMHASFERGVQPSTRVAFSLVEFFILPSSGRICFTAELRIAAIRTSQSGS